VGLRGALGSANYCTRGEPIGDLGHLDFALPALLRAGHEDYETVNLRDAVSTPADFRNCDIILFSDLNWLRLEGPESAAASAAAIVPSSETRLFTS